ncbi:type II toxin-antitoxin system death-on-curing family toxin [Modestobacter lapidis]|nr:type II toxin-antitoxin system death-on-curing family toxin [Modestobacter lapidis]
MTVYLDIDDVLALAGQAAIRDVGLLASAVARPQATVFGEDAYPDLYTKAAALLHSLAGNHALVDGNKRLAWRACAVFLGLNGHRPHATQAEVVELVVAVADGSLNDVATIAERLTGMTS